MNKQVDIFSDIEPDISIKTHRSGKFRFLIGVDMDRVQPLIDRVVDAHNRFASVPMLPQVAQELELNVIVASVFGTNTIEGGTISEDEIEELFNENLPIEEIKEEKKRRVVNIKNAYDLADKLANQHGEFIEGEVGIGFEIDEPLILELHEMITGGLTHSTNTPGRYRNNEKGYNTKVGDKEHGGVYTPPKCLDDIKMLMSNFIQWANSDSIMELHPLIRAPLIHYYFERVHPFFDGNGRVGRVLEAIVLKCSGMMYAPFGLAKSYLDHLDEYFLVFNKSRKSEIKGEEFPNTYFIEFFLHRIREVFDYLHDRVNSLIGFILYENVVHQLLVEKKINSRQFTIIQNLFPKGNTHKLNDVQSQIWYRGLYENLTRKTRDRDLKSLVELKLIEVENKQIELMVP